MSGRGSLNKESRSHTVHVIWHMLSHTLLTHTHGHMTWDSISVVTMDTTHAYCTQYLKNGLIDVLHIWHRPEENLSTEFWVSLLLQLQKTLKKILHSFCSWWVIKHHNEVWGSNSGTEGEIKTYKRDVVCQGRPFDGDGRNISRLKVSALLLHVLRYVTQPCSRYNHPDLTQWCLLRLITCSTCEPANDQPWQQLPKQRPLICGEELKITKICHNLRQQSWISNIQKENKESLQTSSAQPQLVARTLLTCCIRCGKIEFY